EHHVGADPHARRRDRHRHLPGQRSDRHVAGALGPHARRAARGAHRRREGRDAAREAAGVRTRHRQRRPCQDHARQPALGRLHRPRGEVSRPARPALPDHEDAGHPGAGHRDGAERDRDRSGGRDFLRARRPGPEDRRSRGARARPGGARAGADAADLTMLGRYRAPVRSWIDPIGRVLYQRLHLRPNHLTVLGLGVSLLAAGAFVTGRTRCAGGLLILAGLCDFFDGSLARASGQVSAFGAFLDSVIDRYSDLVVLLGIVVLFAQMPHARGAVVAMAGLVGSMMVSYTKARAESIGITCTVGIMERPERMICLIAGGVFDLLEPALWVLAILANLTALQRIAFTRRAMRESELLRLLVCVAVLLLPAGISAAPAGPTESAAVPADIERAWGAAVEAYQHGDPLPLI